MNQLTWKKKDSSVVDLLFGIFSSWYLFELTISLLYRRDETYQWANLRIQSVIASILCRVESDLQKRIDDYYTTSNDYLQHGYREIDWNKMQSSAWWSRAANDPTQLGRSISEHISAEIREHGYSS